MVRRLAEGRYPSMVFSEDRVESLLKTAISAAAHWVSVSEDENGVSGALVCMTYDTLWAERQTAAILVLHAEIPGDGLDLMREFLRWTKARRIIKQIELDIDNIVDVRAGKLLQRLGFSATGTVYRRFR